MAKNIYNTYSKQKTLKLVEKTQILKNKVFVGSGYKNWDVEHKTNVFFNYKFESVIRFEAILLSFKRAIHFLFENIKKNWWHQMLFVFSNVIKKLNFSKISTLLKKRKQAYLKIWLPGFLTNYRQSLRKSTKKKKKQPNKYGLPTLYFLKKKIPQIMLFFSVSSTNKLGIIESSKFKIPIIGVCDTDAPYGLVQYPIFGNDDSPISFKFYIAIINKLIESAKLASLLAEKLQLDYKMKRAEQLRKFLKKFLNNLKYFFSFSLFFWVNEQHVFKKVSFQKTKKLFLKNRFKLLEKNLFFENYDYILEEKDKILSLYREPQEKKRESILKLIQDENLIKKVEEKQTPSRSEKRAVKFARFLKKQEQRKQQFRPNVKG